MAADRTWLSGSMGMLILRLLSEKDMYGYEMIDTLRKRSTLDRVFELKAGTLYPLLHGLEEKHYLTSYEQEVLGKVRKYYRITREGKIIWRKESRVEGIFSGGDRRPCAGGVRMKPEEYLHTVTDQIRCAGARDMVEEELREHIRDQAEAYEAEGMFEEEALEKGGARHGGSGGDGRCPGPDTQASYVVGHAGAGRGAGIFGIVLQAALAAGGGDVSGSDGLYWLHGHIRYTVLGIVLMLAVCRLDYTVLAGRARRIAAVYLIMVTAGILLFGSLHAGAVYIDAGSMHVSVPPLCIFISRFTGRCCMTAGVSDTGTCGSRSYGRWFLHGYPGGYLPCLPR